MDVSWPIWVLLAAFAVQLAGIALSLTANAAFLAAHPVLRDGRDMAAFKRRAAADMWAALVGLAAVVVATAVLTAAFVFGMVGEWEGLLFAGGYCAVMTPLWLWVRHLERRVQAVPAASEELTDERDHVVYIWQRKPFPTWE